MSDEKKLYFVQEVGVEVSTQNSAPQVRGGYNAGNQFETQPKPSKSGEVDKSKALTKAECTG